MTFFKVRIYRCISGKKTRSNLLLKIYILDEIASTNSLKSSDSGLRIKCIASNSVGEKSETTVLEISGFGKKQMFDFE